MLARHEIYLLEAVEGVVATLGSVKEHHERITEGSTVSVTAVRETKAGFRHRTMMLTSTSLRLKSLEKRTKNIINLVNN